MIEVTGGEQLLKLAADLRAAGTSGRRTRNKLGTKLRRALRPAVAEVKARALAIPSSGKKSTGLRAQIAAATRSRVLLAGASPMVRIQVDGSRMPSGKRTLPFYMDGQSQWRHPVFGDTEVWVDQAAHRYFLVTVLPYVGPVQIAIVAAAEETAVELERGL